MAEKLEAQVTLIPSSGGVFEVAVNEKNIFSKKHLKRFPNEGEVVQLIRQMVDGKKD